MSRPDKRPEGPARYLKADWVLPPEDEPIRDGAVLIEAGVIRAVGAHDELAHLAATAEVTRFDGCVIIPGLVNAHTHLSLTALLGVAPPSEFTEWLDVVVPRIKEMDAETLRRSAAAGIRRMLRAGITTVGDVTYSDESVEPASAAGMSGVFFREVLGVRGDEVEPRLSDTGFFDAVARLSGKTEAGHPRVRLGISAHAPYSTGPGAIRACHAIAAERSLPLMMHVAESPAEETLMLRGEGRLSSLAHRLAPDLEPPGTGTVTYLDSLGALDGLIAVHAVHVSSAEARLLADKARGVVLCPRSNIFLECGEAPVATYDEAGVAMALGTDSAASNRDFDLFAEARALLSLHAGLSPGRLLRMLTSEGAKVIGIEGRNTLRPGTGADLAVVATGPTEDPVRDLVLNARARDVRMVVAGGRVVA